MKKWWLILLICSLVSVVRGGQAIALVKAESKCSYSENTKTNSKISISFPHTTSQQIGNAAISVDPLAPVLKLKKHTEPLIGEEPLIAKLLTVKPTIAEPSKSPLPNQVAPPKSPLPESKPNQAEPSKPPLSEPLPNQTEQPKPAPQTEKPSVYLTFDDGPNEHLNEILDILKAKNAKATFFMIEPQIHHYQEAVKRLVAEGHYPALHSVSHDKNKLYGGNPSNVVNEMEQTRKTLLEVTGVDSKLARAPYGSKPYMTEPFRKALADDGMKLWDWNIDSMDWKYQKTNPQQILTNIQQGFDTVKNKQGPIVILMHVTKGTAAILPQVIDFIAAKGYQCAPYSPQKHQSMNFWNDPRL